MAITQVGSATSATSAGTAVTGLDFAVPTGIQAGDVLIASFVVNHASEIRLASRWIALDITDNGDWCHVVAIKVANGADTGNYNFGIWLGTSLMVITCTAWRGVSDAWPCESGESEHTSDSSGGSEPQTTPTVSSTVDAGRVLYIRAIQDAAATAPTFSTAAGGVTELVDAGTDDGSTAYATCQYVDNSDFSGQGSKSGLAITCSQTETDNSLHTIVLRAKEDEQAWTYDGTTTWTRPDSSVDSVLVECFAGGGGGGAGTANPGSGGGGAGGSYSRKTLAVDGTAKTVTVASPVGNAATDGSTGQTTWFSANSSSGVVAVGGPGGSQGTSTSTGGAGGTGTTTGCHGDVVFAGGNGSQVNTDLGGSSGGSGASPAGAGNSASASTPGDTKRYGGGRGGMGRGAVSGSGQLGHQGMWYGGGGAGGNTTVSSNCNGGWGGGGLVRITYGGKWAPPTRASVTAVAHNPTVQAVSNEEANPTVAEASVDAHNATVTKAAQASPTRAQVTADAHDATVTVFAGTLADATHAPVTADAHDAAPSLASTPTATHAPATVDAHDAAVDTSKSADATHAPVGAVAHDAAVDLHSQPVATHGVVTVVAHDSTTDLDDTVNDATHATATAVAHNAIGGVAALPTHGTGTVVGYSADVPAADVGEPAEADAGAVAHDASTDIATEAEAVAITVLVNGISLKSSNRVLGVREFFKDRHAVLDFEFDWGSNRLGPSETITASTIITSPGIIVDSTEFSGGTVTVWLSAGSAGKTYTVTNRITTNQGRTYDRSMFIRVTER